MIERNEKKSISTQKAERDLFGNYCRGMKKRKEGQRVAAGTQMDLLNKKIVENIFKRRGAAHTLGGKTAATSHAILGG